MSDIARQIGQLIASARQKRGWTQRALAAALGCGQPAVAQWESGVRSPAATQIVGIAECLGIPPARLLPSLTTESMYSPTPWSTAPGGVVYDAGGVDIGIMDFPTDADLVQAAVNSYDPCGGTRWVCETHGIHPVTGDQACDTTAGKPCPRCVPFRPPVLPTDADLVAELGS